MSKYFGKTWWGEKWLNALAHIDYGNRLPRGSAYARAGKVTDIRVEKNKITASVAGSRPKPYKVSIVIPAFTQNEIGSLIQGIAEKPAVISKLLNGTLEPELLMIAERHGLNIFPKKWSDLSMKCSCPDSAVPCKHLAAVIYKVSSEIDNNPFLAFTLHQVDLPAELKKQNIHISAQMESKIPSLESLWFLEKGTSSKTQKNKAAHESPWYQKLNFTALSPIHEPLVVLLAETPPFYQGNGSFREKYHVQLSKAVRNAWRMVQDKNPVGKFFPAPNNGEPLITRHTQLSLHVNNRNIAGLILEGISGNLSLEEAVAELWQLPAAYIQDYQPSVSILRTSLVLAMNLVANGAIVPQIVLSGDKRYVIRWLPALISKAVKSLTERIEAALPEQILYYANKEVEKDAGVNLLSAWLNVLVPKLSGAANADLFTGLFFDNARYGFAGPGEQALPSGIYQWLQCYYLAQGRFRPSIVVEEVQDDRFMIMIHVHETAVPLQQPVPLREVLTLKKYDTQRFEILQSLARLSSFIPGLDQYINSKGDDLIILDMRQFTPFLMQAIPAIQLLDVHILLPKSLQEILKPRASVRIKQKSKDSNGFLRLDKLLDFDWQVAMGDTIMGEEEFKKLLKTSEGLIKFKSGYIYVSQSDLEKLHRHFSSSKEMSAFGMLRAALSNDYYGAKVSLSDEVQELIGQLTRQPDVALPQNLNATLRPYQHRGYSWMYRNTQIGFGSVLADDMGLGKTLQVITTLLKYKEDGALKKEKALIIAPTGLLTNWQAEIEKFAPSLKLALHHGTARRLDPADDYDILLTSYGTARADTDKLKKMKWHAVIIDEAQNIKNHDTAQSKAVKSIPANTFIAMSGTPVENRLTELWSIMDFSNRGFLGSLNDFKDHFATPIQNQNDENAASKLKLITSPVMMRRLKSDKSIISDLPEKIEIDSFATLAKEQAGLYEKTLQKAMDEIEGITQTDQKSLFVRQGLVLQMILALKQICNHPTHFLKNNILDPSLSGKMQLLFDKVESILESGEKVLIFTQFTEMGHLLKTFLASRFDDEPMFFHGGCSVGQRKDMVERFQKDRSEKIFILSLKAAGTGLNLTAANHVIHYDLWWNPAVEAQATDRAYRIGQKKNVMVHRFITKGTFEERINELIQSKKHLADMTVTAGENWIGNLSSKELKEMFSLG